MKPKPAFFRASAAALLVAAALLLGFASSAFAAQGLEPEGDAQATLVQAAGVTAGSGKQAAVDISKATVSKVSSKKYTGKAIKPVPKVKYKGKALKKGRDFKLSYKNNKKAGTAKIIITGKGSYTGSKTVKFKIVKSSAKSSAKKKSSSSASEGGTVYWTPGGSVYHYSRSCSTLSRSRTVYSGSISDSGKPRGCKVCG